MTVGSYNENYVKYISSANMPFSKASTIDINAAIPPGQDAERVQPFLIMQSYGPFEVNQSHHMFWLGRFMLALSIQGGILEPY